jgi:hypothetical protein
MGSWVSGLVMMNDEEFTVKWLRYSVFQWENTLIGQTFNGCSAESMFSTCFVIGSSIKAQSTILHICHICKEIYIYIHTAGARALPGAARSFFIFPTECKV